ncbi:MAG: alpha-1,4-glucan--maltose-1-phosphate maltosyltransferase [Herminiimonas sp.]|uniref:alpha-1,4-glucan--maltose-1-phosphate maltosyltransferase n=1 Tax=Herminiimonas sp. TaxID=1926289 RepID=UPI002727D087|nr:alpha-1,4-glucan--maltose-1-phosphate maltosyltransferase [Herminiimonas sp.]MDO9422443.1 alpha-1,4-glucan--maltose-1-phosphate maltosyltransferase [Herminiimonas sp.]
MQSLNTDADNNPHRIYCVSSSSIAALTDSAPLLSRVSAMQFSTILLTDCASLAAQPSAEAHLDHEETITSLLSKLAKECHTHGLRLMIDLEIDRFTENSDFVAQHTEHFFIANRAQTLPDPRFPPQKAKSHRAQLRLDTAGSALALDYWKTRLAALLDVGVSGFRCLSIGDIPPSIWQDLIVELRSKHAGVSFMAWTPGCTPQQLAAIRDCGFDAVFSSDAWWDYRGSWLTEEHARLAALAKVIAAPEDPAGARLIRALHMDDPVSAQRAYQRALHTAATIGDGLMLVQGFESGVDIQLSELQQDQIPQALFNITADIRQANRELAERGTPPASLKLLSVPDADIVLLLRANETGGVITAINADLSQSQSVSRIALQERAAGWAIDLKEDDEAVTLLAGEVRHFKTQPTKAVVLPATGGKAAVVRAARVPRIAIENITPGIDGGRFPAKKIVASVIDIEADIFSDGHDHLAASVWWRAADEKEWHEVAMHEVTNDRWRASISLNRVGRHLFYVEAWRDSFDTYRDELDKKTRAGLDVTLEIQEGRQLLEKVITGQPDDSLHTTALKKLLKLLPAKSRKKVATDHTETIALLLSPDTATLMHASDLREFSTRSELDYRIDVERKAAEFSNWYELFPRSQSGDVNRHGNFDDVIARMPAVRDMGFDTLYFPPIHPIGRKNMKGKNNSLTPGPDDPGSPYAIGSEAGGHDAVHPELGTLEDFRRMLAAAKDHGLEIALDFAIQCSPDHPWLQDHPEWFAWRPDGSIRYAENPPKKYEDIVNVDFYAETEDGSAIPDLWIALRDVVLMWVREGVRVFRVDNPHTKPLPFWEWMIGDIRARAPDTIFLAEAFTRPKPMYRLAKVGFSQSYTYFTWRHTKQEFTDYLNELTAEIPAGGPREFFRPHFFVNTPDINPYFLQRSGRAGFVIRAALAATLSGLWGVYSGFELCEAQAVTSKEEYLDSEKYEIRAWDWQRPGNIVREVTLLNRIRNANPALQTHLGVRFHYSSNEQILYFSKSTKGEDADHFGDNAILVAINLDPFAAHDATIDLPLWQLDLPDHASVELEDLVSENRFTWQGRQQQIHLDPQQMPFAIWRLRSGTQ